MAEMTRWPALSGLIGNTPLVRLDRVNPNPRVTLLGKLESRNPGGSIKDRIALSMIEAGERSGALVPGRTILEATSGNTGIGLALVGAAKGYRVLLAMSEGVSVERRKVLSALGASYLLTPAEKGTDGAIEVAYEMAAREKEKYYLPDQYNNPANPLAHYHGTAAEIWEQTGGGVTHVVATMGTTGTLMGVARRLHELEPSVRVVGVEPYLGHRIQGLKNMKEAYRPGIYDKALLDEKVNVEDEAAFAAAREAAAREGLLVGMSGGAALWAAAQLARTLDGGVVVAILPDGGERYLSTSLFVVPEDAARGGEEAPEARGPSFFNTLSHRWEPFAPADRACVKIYSCGPTLDGEPHLGDCRRLLVADLLKRWLRQRGCGVRHVMNVTDLDDRTIGEARRRGVPLRELTAGSEAAFARAMALLGVAPPDVMPRASEHVDEMVALTERLVEKRCAYEKLRSVYFDIARGADYGALSGFDLGMARHGSTEDNDSYEKESPGDFTLLKRSTLDEIKEGVFFKTRWGNVRPGWHIECAAMAMKYLGEEFDIHTASADLIFPHHENEIAIWGALTGKRPARTWLHSEQVLADGRKMARGAGNAVTLESLLAKGYAARCVRHYLLSVHYRQPIGWSPAGLDAARAALERIDGCARRLEEAARGGGEGAASAAGDARLGLIAGEMRESFARAMDDDLNSSAALAAVFGFVRRVNAHADRLPVGGEGARAALAALSWADETLGVLAPAGGAGGAAGEDDAAVRELVARREAARAARDWGLADRLRAEALGMGWIVEDTAGGPRWRRRG